MNSIVLSAMSFRQVVAVLGRGRRRDGMVVVDEVGIPLVGLAAHEAVEPLEPADSGQCRLVAARLDSSSGVRCHLPTQ